MPATKIQVHRIEVGFKSGNKLRFWTSSFEIGDTTVKWNRMFWGLLWRQKTQPIRIDPQSVEYAATLKTRTVRISE